ncbi:MAG: OmpH family outer membrane protein [Pseudomonadota bacterium]
MGLMVIVFTSGFFVVFADGLKIGVVNTEKILRESLPAVQAQKKIEQEFVPRDEDIKKMAVQAKILQDRLERRHYHGGYRATQPGKESGQSEP